jgi:IclR family acetate operon transcriptional repressor
MPTDDKPKRRGRPRQHEGAGYTVQALDRGLTVLAAIGESDGPTAADLTAQTGLPASTVHRLLASLQSHGFIWQEHETDRWRVALRSFLIGLGFARTRRLEVLGREAMEGLRRQTGETVLLAATQGEGVTATAVLPTRAALRVVVEPGSPLSPHASAVGKVLVAHDMTLAGAVLSQPLAALTAATISDPDDLVAGLGVIRQRGWAMDDGESGEDVRAVAAAVKDHTGACVAALGVIGPAARLMPPMIPRVARLTTEAAEAISFSLGWPSMASAPEGSVQAGLGAHYLP